MPKQTETTLLIEKMIDAGNDLDVTLNVYTDILYEKGMTFESAVIEGRRDAWKKIVLEYQESKKSDQMGDK